MFHPEVGNANIRVLSFYFIDFVRLRVIVIAVEPEQVDAVGLQTPLHTVRYHTREGRGGEGKHSFAR